MKDYRVFRDQYNDYSFVCPECGEVGPFLERGDALFEAAHHRSGHRIEKLERELAVKERDGDG